MAKKKATKKKAVRKPQKKTMTLLQQKFLEEYLKVRNATEAAKRAGVKGNNHKQRGHQLLHDPLVQAKLKEFTMKKWKEREAAIDRMLDRLEYMISDDFEESDITDVLEWDDRQNITIKSLDDIPFQARRAIKSLKQVMSKDGDRGIQVELKETGQALAAMKLFGEYMGMKEYMKEMREKEKAVEAKAESRAGEIAEQSRMDRLLANARLYEKRAGQEDPDNS